MGKSVTLKGAAAKAFLGLTGHVQAKTDDEALMEVATAIYLNMKTNDHDKAVLILKAFRVGADTTLLREYGQALEAWDAAGRTPMNSDNPTFTTQATLHRSIEERARTLAKEVK